MAADERLWLSRSWTTRERRAGEPADAYVFVTPAQFMERVEAGGFLEWAEFLGNQYGTPVPDPPAGCDVLLEIDLQGASQVLERCPGAVLVLLVPPSQEAQAERLRLRGDRPEQIARRLAVGREEERQGRAMADHVVVNDDIDQAVAEIQAIIEEHRQAAGQIGRD